MSSLGSTVQALTVAGAFALSGCAPSATVDFDRDETVPIRAGSTYALASGANVGEAQDPALQSGIVHQRIQTAIHDELKAKGFELADTNSATFLVRYFLAFHRGTDYVPTTSYSYGYGYGWGWGGYGGVAVTTSMPVETREAAFLIDMIDRQSGKLAWRGWIKGDAPDKPPPQEKVSEVVGRVLSQMKVEGTK
jgi:hypothetical protein